MQNRQMAVELLATAVNALTDAYNDLDAKTAELLDAEGVAQSVADAEGKAVATYRQIADAAEAAGEPLTDDYSSRIQSDFGPGRRVSDTTLTYARLLYDRAAHRAQYQRVRVEALTAIVLALT